MYVKDHIIIKNKNEQEKRLSKKFDSFDFLNFESFCFYIFTFGIF